MSKYKYTIGIEEEYQVVDIDTRALIPRSSEIIKDGQNYFHEHLKPEMHMAAVELETDICRDIHEAHEKIYINRKQLVNIAHKHGLRVCGGGTHPFSDWIDQLITDNPRYIDIVGQMRDVARSNLIYGLHVHIGIPNKEEAVQVQNSIRYFLPHIYALSTCSPFWCGRDTGFKSYRSKVFEKFPRTGIPPYFSSAADLESYTNLLIKTRCIENAKNIYWDARVHPFFPTLEFRVCDMPLQKEETICIAAICQCITAKIHKLQLKNMDWRATRRIYINENKWRAARFGIDAHFLDFSKDEEVSYRTLVLELLDFIDDVMTELNCRNEVEYCLKILENGTGADRILKIYNETGDFKNVVDYMVYQTEMGIF